MVKSVEIPTCLTPPPLQNCGEMPRAEELKLQVELASHLSALQLEGPFKGPVSVIQKSWENRKIIGKTWENHGKIMGFSETEYENHGI